MSDCKSKTSPGGFGDACWVAGIFNIGYSKKTVKTKDKITTKADLSARNDTTLALRLVTFTHGYQRFFMLPQMNGINGGRGGRDRTDDLLFPKQARFRCATPRI